jgi:hypothetical protein
MVHLPSVPLDPTRKADLARGTSIRRLTDIVRQDTVTRRIACHGHRVSGPKRFQTCRMIPSRRSRHFGERCFGNRSERRQSPHGSHCPQKMLRQARTTGLKEPRCGAPAWPTGWFGPDALLDLRVVAAPYALGEWPPKAPSRYLTFPLGMRASWPEANFHMGILCQAWNTLMFAISRDRHENFFTCFGKRCVRVAAPGQSRRHGQ